MRLLLPFDYSRIELGLNPYSRIESLVVAPVIVFGYKRPSHLKRVLDSLASNPEAIYSKLFIAIDGPGLHSETSLVDECRNIARQVTGFKEVVTFFQEQNIGLANSIIKGVSKVLEEHESVIVLEDDLFVSPHFLGFMNNSLSAYRSETLVASIHGYQYPLRGLKETAHFLRGADCWGWATWRDRWKTVDFESSNLLKDLSNFNLKLKFNMYGALKNYEMLKKQEVGEIDSWAIRWHASMFIQGKLTLFPPKSLVLNLGLDGSGTHEGNSSLFNTKLAETSVNITRLVAIKESKQMKHKMIYYFYKERIKLVFRSKFEFMKSNLKLFSPE